MPLFVTSDCQSLMYDKEVFAKYYHIYFKTFGCYQNFYHCQLNLSCRMCTQFHWCFLILSQYLLLAKKASNFPKKYQNEKLKF